MHNQDGYDGSAEQRTQAMNTTMAKNDEAIAQLKSTFADSIDTANLVVTWRRVLSISIPLIIATIKMNVQGYTLEMGDWWSIAVMWFWSNLLLGGIAGLRWRKQLVEQQLAAKVIGMLIAHKQIIDMVSLTEKKGNVDIAELNNTLLELVIRQYQSYFSYVTASLRMNDWLSDEDKGRLADKALKSSTGDLVKLLSTRPWLERYRKMLQEL